jgi:hypothetical protein
MSVATAFVYNGSGEWKVSAPDEWDLDIASLDGDEKILGHHKIDEAICKVVQSKDGKIIAISK